MARNRRRKRTNNRSTQNRIIRRNNAVPMQLAPAHVTQTRPLRRPRVLARGGGQFRVRCSDEGIRFLKAAIAPRDFPGIIPSGIPDRFGGKSFVMQHTVVTSYATVIDVDNYLLLLPSLPGALWTGSGTISTATNWMNYPFASVASNVFGYTAATTAASVTPFISGYRVIGGTIEILPQTAPANTPNVCYVTRQKVSVNVTSSGTVTTASQDLMVFGLSAAALSVATGSGSYYSGPLASGVYAPLTCQDPAWTFRQPYLGQSKIPLQGTTDDGTLNAQVLGFDNSISSVFVTIPAYTAVQTLLVSVSLLVEYQPAANTLLEQIAHQAPMHDPYAMELYELYSRDMPIAVPAYENAGFWKMFLAAIGEAGAFVAKFVPGLPGAVIGAAAGAATAISSALQ